LGTGFSRKRGKEQTTRMEEAVKTLRFGGQMRNGN
jgi:hypothetical protein